MKQLLHKLQENRGTSEFIAFVSCLIALLAVFYICTMATIPFMVKGDVQAYTKALARQIEVQGAIDDEINVFADDLAEMYNIDPTITYHANYIGTTKHIQIRDSFTVKVETEVPLEIFNGSLFKTHTINIPIKGEEVGISEKLWKD